MYENTHTFTEKDENIFLSISYMYITVIQLIIANENFIFVQIQIIYLFTLLNRVFTIHSSINTSLYLNNS